MVNNSLHSVESFSFLLGIFNNIVTFLKYKRDRWWVVQNFALLTIRAEGATFLNGCPYRLFIICHITSPFWVTENCHSSTSCLSAQPFLFGYFGSNPLHFSKFAYGFVHIRNFKFIFRKMNLTPYKLGINWKVSSSI